MTQISVGSCEWRTVSSVTVNGSQYCVHYVYTNANANAKARYLAKSCNQNNEVKSDNLIYIYIYIYTNSDLNVTDQESPQGCSKCNRSRCKTCLYLKPAQKVKSHSAGLTYSIRTKSQCDTPNVIHVISCKRCGIQYVGETKTN